ncbi:unnamed protein product [Adineta steineri]|uniref:Uncharacterized protein n=1 Tax=Adineta steineri TaxID=433720 RepID=A0A819RFG9_9BILA|nr:unnamed protein product [Adineta steineri]
MYGVIIDGGAVILFRDAALSGIILPAKSVPPIPEFSRVWNGIALQLKTVRGREGSGFGSAVEFRNLEELGFRNSGIR